MLDNPVALLVAIIGSAGFGGFFREIVSGVGKLRAGISAKESVRKRDLVSERDYEYDRAEAEARNRRRIENFAAGLQRQLILQGFEHLVPSWPKLEEVPDRSPGSPVPTVAEE